MRAPLPFRAPHCPVHTPGQTGYTDAVTTWGRPDDRPTPIAVVRPDSVDDVVGVVDALSGTGLDVAVRGAGHHVAGSAVATDGVVVDMRSLTGIEHFSGNLIRVGAGCTWERTTSAALAAGGMIPAGNDPSTGVVGLALGGGIGPLSRSWGLTCDRIRSVGLVDGNAVFRRIGDDDGELLAVLRGAGRGLGIVTDIEFEAVPCEPTVPTAQLVVGADDPHTCLTAWATTAAGSATDTNAQITLRTFPDSSTLPPAVRGRRVAVLGAVFTGTDETVAAQELAPFGELDDVLMDASGEAPLAEAARPWRTGLRATSTAHFLDDLDGESVAALADLAWRAPPGGSLTVRLLGGRIADADPVTSVFAHRHAAFQVIAQVEWTSPEQDAAARAWCAQVDLRLDAVGSVGVYGNFCPSVEDFARRRDRAYGDTERIDRALAECDPTGIFRGAAFRP